VVARAFAFSGNTTATTASPCISPPTSTTRPTASSAPWPPPWFPRAPSPPRWPSVAQRGI